MILILSQCEIERLTAEPLESLSDREFRRFLERLLLLLDPATGEIEIPGATFDDIRRFAFSSGVAEWENLLVSVFGRTLGKNLDLGFFGEQ